MRRKRLYKRLMGLGLEKRKAEKLVKNTWETYGKYSEEDYEYFKRLVEIEREDI